MEEKENRALNSDNPLNSSTSNPTKDEISEIMQDIKAEVLCESDEDQKALKSGTNAFLLTPEMKVKNSTKMELKMSLEELKNFIREIVREELNKS